MVGKPNFPPDVEDRSGIRGPASPTPGMTALDAQREASLADEGGRAAAVIESQDVEEAGESSGLAPSRASSRRMPLALMLGAAGLLGLAILGRMSSRRAG